MKKINNLVLFTIFVLGIFLFLDSNSYVVEADTPEKKSVFIVDSMTEDLLYEQFLFSTITTFKELRPNSAYKFFSLSSPHESFEIISNQNDSKIYIVPVMMLTLYYNFICYDLYKHKKNKFDLKKAKKVFAYSILYLFLIFVLFLLDYLI